MFSIGSPLGIGRIEKYSQSHYMCGIYKAEIPITGNPRLLWWPQMHYILGTKAYTRFLFLLLLNGRKGMRKNWTLVRKWNFEGGGGIMFLAFIAKKKNRGHEQHNRLLWNYREGGSAQRRCVAKNKSKKWRKKSALQIIIARIRPRSDFGVFKSIFFRHPNETNYFPPF